MFLVLNKLFYTLDFCRLTKDPSASSANKIRGSSIYTLYSTFHTKHNGNFTVLFQFFLCSKGNELGQLLGRCLILFPFNWSQTCPQSYFRKLKTSFSPSSYSEKMCWGQGWAEASLSTLLWLYILVRAVVQKYHEMIFTCIYSQF